MRGSEFFVSAATRPPFNRLHPKVAAFFKDYLAKEKVVPFGDRFVVNTHFPPYPSDAFDNMVEHFAAIGDSEQRSLYSVTFAVTNRCNYNCRHCYNAGRSQNDLPLDIIKDLAEALQNLGVVMVTLTGGEPLLRDDLEEIAGLFDSKTCLVLGTSGDRFTSERAKSLKNKGIFAVGVSLDSDVESEHDFMRGKDGAFQQALRTLRIARDEGLYPYVVSLATREFLREERFFAFLEFVSDSGALEVHLIEPSATGKLAGRTDVLLSKDERRLIFDYQGRVAEDEGLPIVSSFAYLESPEAFGCGAGLTHIYIDGSGEVCPCNLVPMSFGNVTRTPFAEILDRMGRHFKKPRPSCAGCMLAKYVPDGQLPCSPETSAEICEAHLPKSHGLPRFFKVRSEAGERVAAPELKEAYDRVHEDYGRFWLFEAARPIDDLVERIPWKGTERVFEAGCGTGYATALLSTRAADVTAVDVSSGMLRSARKRMDALGARNVEFIEGDALAILESGRPFDIVFSSWVLGYIPLKPFFEAAHRALPKDGLVAFVVHRENSPREPLEIFGELVATDPSILTKQVLFDFPADADAVCEILAPIGFDVRDVREGRIVFTYNSAESVLEHLLLSGAGTAFYDAVVPGRREALSKEFLRMLSERSGCPDEYKVAHEYVACIAVRK